MTLSRRQVLRFAALGTGAFAVGLGGTVACWWNQDSGPDLAYLSSSELEFLEAFAAAAYPATETVPMDGREARLSYFFDSAMRPMTDTDRGLIRAVLHVLNQVPRASGRGSFVGLEPDQRSEVLIAWLESPTYEIRALTQTLVLLLGMGYSVHPKVSPILSQWHGCGFGV